MVVKLNLWNSEQGKISFSVFYFFRIFMADLKLDIYKAHFC